MTVDKDSVGERGEIIVKNLLTRRYGRALPLFRVQFLGEKHASVDFIIELTGADETYAPFFLVQVKSTS